MSGTGALTRSDHMQCVPATVSVRISMASRSCFADAALAREKCVSVWQGRPATDDASQVRRQQTCSTSNYWPGRLAAHRLELSDVRREVVLCGAVIDLGA